YPFANGNHRFHVQVSCFHRPSQYLVSPRAPSNYGTPAWRRSNSAHRDVSQFSRVVNTNIAFLPRSSGHGLDRLVDGQLVAHVHEQSVSLDVDLSNVVEVYSPLALDIVDHHLLIVKHLGTEEADREDKISRKFRRGDPVSAHPPASLKLARQANKSDTLFLEVNNRPVRDRNLRESAHLPSRRVSRSGMVQQVLFRPCDLRLGPPRLARGETRIDSVINDLSIQRVQEKRSYCTTILRTLDHIRILRLHRVRSDMDP